MQKAIIQKVVLLAAALSLTGCSVTDVSVEANKVAPEPAVSAPSTAGSKADLRERMPEQPFGIDAAAELDAQGMEREVPSDGAGHSIVDQTGAVRLFLQMKWLGVERNAFADPLNAKTAEAHLKDVEKFFSPPHEAEIDTPGAAKTAVDYATAFEKGKAPKLSADETILYHLYPGILAQGDDGINRADKKAWPDYQGEEVPWVTIDGVAIPFKHKAKARLETEITSVYDNGDDTLGIESMDTLRVALADGRTAVFPVQSTQVLAGNPVAEWKIVQATWWIEAGTVSVEGKKKKQ